MPDGYLLYTEPPRSVRAVARAAVARDRPPEATCEAILPGCAEALADDDGTAAALRLPAQESGLGGAIGHRPFGGAAETPLHAHLVCALGGLDRGAQEELYSARHGALGLVARRALAAGDFNALGRARDDIPRVRITSAAPSVAIHLTNGTGCGLRHAYYPETCAARAFRFGYENVPGEDP